MLGLGVSLTRPYATKPNLVANGTFDTNTTGWTAVNAAIASTGGKLRISNTATSGHAVAPIATVIGVSYTITAEYAHISGTIVGSQLNVSNNADGSASYAVAFPSAGFVSLTFTATATTTYISLRAGGVDEVHDWDNVVAR